MPRQRPRYRSSLFAGLAAAALVSGCSMSTGWFIQKSLRDAGFTRSQARCAVDNISARLSQDQLWSLRAPLVRYIMLDDPAETMDVDRFLAWLAPEVPAEVHHVVSHYATHCRLRS